MSTPAKLLKTGQRRKPLALVRGSAEWRARGEEIIARLRETTQRLRELGRDAAEAADIETGWFCDKQIKDLETKIAETQATLDRTPLNEKDQPAGENPAAHSL